MVTAASRKDQIFMRKAKVFTSHLPWIFYGFIQLQDGNACLYEIIVYIFYLEVYHVISIREHIVFSPATKMTENNAAQT